MASWTIFWAESTFFDVTGKHIVYSYFKNSENMHKLDFQVWREADFQVRTAGALLLKNALVVKSYVKTALY